MGTGRCPLKCNCNHNVSRRQFIRTSAGVLAAPVMFAGFEHALGGPVARHRSIRPCGPAATYTPVVRAAFVRRKEEYGMLWPGAVYDGEAAKKMYTTKLIATARDMGAKLDLRDAPIYSLEEAENWIRQAEETNADGMFLIVLDRQRHSWPTARKVAASAIPSVIYSPLGTSFTTNTIHLADTPGCVVYSTNDFGQAAYGFKMLCAKARMQRTRCVVIKGAKRYDSELADTGIMLRNVPARTFIDTYNDMEQDDDVMAMADSYMRQARRRTGATRQDVLNGVKSYYVAGKILENEEADAITMDCLGALGRIPVSLPCIAWSRMNDDRIPAACEADLGAVASHIMTQYLFDRPGFQQDPVADTADDSIIGAHCSCPTRLNGFDKSPEPFDLMHHHGNRDAVPRTLWKKGQRVTSVDLLPGKVRDSSDGARRVEESSKVLISAGTVLENMDVPPSGGCVVSVKVKFDGNQEVLSFPGFHQLFFYGDHADRMKDFCQLCNFEAQIV
mgnify:FL=1